jgi:hypothetical protein
MLKGSSMKVSEIYNLYNKELIIEGKIKQSFNVAISPAKKTEAHIKKFDNDFYTLVDGIRSRTKFNRRKYGVADFFCWASSSEVDISCAPWPAVNFPKSVLFVEIALKLERSGTLKAA